MFLRKGKIEILLIKNSRFFLPNYNRMQKRFWSPHKYEVYKTYDSLLNIKKNNPEEIIKLLETINKEMKSDCELIKCITNHLFDFSDDYFCPQIIKILENFEKLKYSDETLLGFVSHRINDLTSVNSSLRINTLIHIFKQLNFHHPIIKNPVIEQLNEHICNYKIELVNILKNLSYLYIDSFTINNIMNHMYLNKENYDKHLFVLFEAFTRLEFENGPNMFIDLVLKKIKNIEKENNLLDLKNSIKFLSGYKRLGLNEKTPFHLEFEKKINNIKLLQPNNISYILLLMLCTKWKDVFFLEQIIMHIENFVNSGEFASIERTDAFFFSSNVEKENNIERKYNSVFTLQQHNKKEIQHNSKEMVKKNSYATMCNEYIVRFLPFHILLLVLLHYDNKNSLIHLLQICVDEYLSFYDVSNIIKLIYATTLLMLDEKGGNKDMDKNIITLFLSIQDVYKSAKIHDLKILYDCFFYHQKKFQGDKRFLFFYNDLLTNECYSVLPSFYSDLNFDNLEVVKCVSSTYLKKENTIYVYLNKNDFYSVPNYKYDNILLNVKFKIELLKRLYGSSFKILIIYNGKELMA